MTLAVAGNLREARGLFGIRRPKGYVGIDHVTIGSDILSVLHILKLPEQVIGKVNAQRLAQVNPNDWYPIEWLLTLMDTLDKEVGHYGLLRMGRRLFQLSHEKRVLEVAKSASDILHALDSMYHHANRGKHIGGWKVLSFAPGQAELEKNTPHHCVMEQGILSAALAAVGCPGIVVQRQCFRQGADTCVYTISSSLTDARWSG